MNKRIILLITVAIASVAAIILLIGVVESNYFHDIILKTDGTDLTVEIYNSNKNKIGSFTSNEYTISLKKGDYYYAVKTENFDDSKIKFQVQDSAKIVNVKATRLSSYLEQLYDDEKDEIMAVINTSYKSIISKYDVLKGQLFDNDEWFGAIIKRKINSRDTTDLYRVILHKEGDTWAMVHYPEIVITKSDFPSVPSSVIDGVNNLIDQEV